MFPVLGNELVKNLLANMPAGDEVIIIKVKKAAEKAANDIDDDYVEYVIDTDQDDEEKSVCPICSSIKEDAIFDRFVDTLDYLSEEDRDQLLADDSVFDKAVSIIVRDDDDEEEEDVDISELDDEDIDIDELEDINEDELEDSEV